ncbi:MAG: hypothetical protein M0P16_07405 [Syntrophales bacterium]|nr:hypothetical protein [Syntrophales bacterium]
MQQVEELRVQAVKPIVAPSGREKNPSFWRQQVLVLMEPVQLRMAAVPPEPVEPQVAKPALRAIVFLEQVGLSPSSSYFPFARPYMKGEGKSA